MLKSYSIGLSNHAPRRFTSGAAVPIARGPENTRDCTLLNGAFFLLISYLQKGTLGRYSTNSDSISHLPPPPQPDDHEPAQTCHPSPSTNACRWQARNIFKRALRDA